MIIGFSKHGRGSTGDGAVNYLTEGMTSAVGYMTAKTKRGLERKPPPVVLRGDPRLTRLVINSVPFKRRYVSGVLSFSEARIGPEVERQIMERFEATAFAGLTKESYNILWVRHAHAGRHEMHFVAPAIDLGSGKSLNINPPRKSTRETFDLLRRLINDEFQLSDPDAPGLARMIRVPSHLAKGAPTRDKLRTAVGAYLEAKLQAGRIKDREDVLRLLREAGYTVSRVGEKYVTIVDQAGKRCRLRGALFEQGFVPHLPNADRAQLSPKERTELEDKLARLVAARIAFNQKRYRIPAVEPERLHSLPAPQSQVNTSQAYDRTGAPFADCLGALDERISGSRRTIETALERVSGSVRRWREATRELERRSIFAHDARERLERATHAFGERASEAIRHFKEQQMTRSLFAKYGIAMATAGSREEREYDMELEAELCDDY